MGSNSCVYSANKKSPFSEIDKTDHQLSFYAASKKYPEIRTHYYSQV